MSDNLFSSNKEIDFFTMDHKLLNFPRHGLQLTPSAALFRKSREKINSIQVLNDYKHFDLSQEKGSHWVGNKSQFVKTMVTYPKQLTFNIKAVEII